MNNTTYAILIYFLVASLVTFILFAVDKKKAIKHEWRIPEKTLILFSLFGGATGAMIAMYNIRHKNKKPKFFISIPIFLVLHILVLIGAFYGKIQIPFI